MDGFVEKYLAACSDFQRTPCTLVLECAEAVAAGLLFPPQVILRGDRKELFEARLTDADILPLAAALEKDNEIVLLDLSTNKVGDAGAAALAKALTQNKTLQALILRNNEVGPEGAKALSSALSGPAGSSVLLQLDLYGNPLDRNGGISIASMIRANNTLQSLDVGNTEQNTESLVALLVSMRGNTGLVHIGLENPRLKSVSDETTLHAATMLRHNKTLQSIDLSKNGIRDDGAEHLVQALLENSSLRVLNLRSNKITIPGAQSFAKYLSHRPESSLSSLILAYNRVDDAGSLAIVQSIRENTSLRYLDLASNSIKSGAMASFFQQLDGNSTLEALRVWGNEFEDDAALALHDLLSTNAVLVDLDVQPYVVDNGESGGTRKAYVAQLTA